jgi:fibronectin type 3 domain-containing protein
MKSKALLIVVSILLLFIIVPKNAFAAYDYRDGFVDGQNMFMTSGYLNSYDRATKAITDNDENTFETLAKFDTGTVNNDSVVYQFTSPVNLQYFRLKSSGATNFTLKNATGGNIANIVYNNGDGSLVSANYSNVYGFSVNNSAGGATATVFEVNVYGTYPSVPTPTPAPTPNPPSPPTGLTGVSGDGNVTLHWNPNPESNITGYYIYVDNNVVNGASLESSTSYTVSGLTNGRNYNFQVVARNSDNLNSNVSTGIMIAPGDSTLPGDVTNYTISNLGSTSMKLNFTTPSTLDFNSYEIYKNGSLLYISSAGIQKNYPLTYSASNLDTDTNYDFKIVAVDTSGNRSLGITRSARTLIPDMTPPTVPTNFSASGENGAGLFTWDIVTASDLKGYFLYKEGVRVFTQPITQNTFNLNGLPVGVGFNYQISAIDNSGNESALSAQYMFSSIDTLPPPIPAGLQVLGSDKKIAVSWVAVNASDLAGYHVFLDGLLIASYVTQTNYNITGLVNGQEYSITVASVDNAGNESLESSEIIGIPAPDPDILPPDVPTSLILMPLDSELQFSWLRVTNPDIYGYNVYRDGFKVNTSIITGNRFDDRAVTNDVYYNYQVSSVDFTGNESAKSVIVTGKPVASNLPKVSVNFTLSDLVQAIAHWFSSIWLILAFCIAIPLSFYVAHRVKNLY